MTTRLKIIILVFVLFILVWFLPVLNVTVTGGWKSIPCPEDEASFLKREIFEDGKEYLINIKTGEKRFLIDEEGYHDLNDPSGVYLGDPSIVYPAPCGKYIFLSKYVSLKEYLINFSYNK